MPEKTAREKAIEAAKKKDKEVTEKTPLSKAKIFKASIPK